MIIMKLSGLFRNHTHVGLSFSDHVIRMVQFRGSADDLSHLQSMEKSLEPGTIENGKIRNASVCLDKLKEMVRLLKARGKRVVFSIPETQLVVRVLELPGLMSDKDLQNYFFIEIGRKIQLPFDRPIFDFHVTARDANTTRVILYAAPEETVRSYQRLLRSAGLDPAAAEFSGLGVDRWIEHAGRKPVQDHRMYVQIENDSFSCTIFDKEVPLFVREVRLQSAQTNGDLSMLISRAVTEITRMLNFYQFTIQKGQSAVTTIYLIGNPKQTERFKNAIQMAVGIQVVSLSVNFEKNKIHKNLQSIFIPALGMAMKEVNE
ncbi:pilus assembly protein PilM [Sporolactobacillus sp. THM7-4]|nr:pilus assembly protein PilM [Sporolactobacillus sp. THM7-4]